MNMPAVVRLVLAATLVSLTACASKPEPAQPGVDINLGPFGPRIQVSGLDHDDATPARVNIGH